MKTVLGIFWRDLKRILRNPVALVVTLGVCIIPSLYAWFNILANWDPYANTSDIAVAVVDKDAGAQAGSMGYVNAGDMVEEKLRENTQLGWTFPDEDDGMESVKSGRYYATIVIPEDFTASLADVLDGDTQKADLDYYVNEKANPVAPKVTDTGADTIEQQVDDTFAGTVSQVIAERVANGSAEALGSLGSANNGSAMSPFYSTLSIWIGAVILCALVKTAPSEEALRRMGAKPRHAYFGRIFFFVLIGLMQTLVIMGRNLFFLEIQCLHPWLYLLCSLVASVVFVNLVFSLTAPFAGMGKAIAVLLMVLQVADSGGTFPMEMLPKAFQAVYPFLPFVHAENCMRAAIAGLYGLDFWVSLAKLAAFLVPSLVLGLLLRKPVIRLNHWFERQLERTKIM